MSRIGNSYPKRVGYSGQAVKVQGRKIARSSVHRQRVKAFVAAVMNRVKVTT
jgi:hypothetical protein